ncbi:MAG: rod shape-determining protein MreC [Treponema sp.]|nr:rod shape-determining protein MreC [Treponema sp.]
MDFTSRSSKFSKHISEIVLVFLLIISGVALGLFSGGFFVDFNQIGFSAMSTMTKGVHSVVEVTNDSVNAVKELASLRQKYKELSEKLKDYEYMRRSNAEIRGENERLKEQLGFSKGLEQKNIVSQIIARDIDNNDESLTIDKGSKDGIRKNMPVIAIQNGDIGVVGKIVNVGMFTSMIMPVYSSNCNIAARIQNTRDVGLVSGNGSIDNELSLQFIRKRLKDELQIGDVIVTSGENDNYLKDIPIGTISKVSDLDYDSSLSIELTPIIDFLRLETVIVVDQQDINENTIDVE